jgi:hypothetical protein
MTNDAAERLREHFREYEEPEDADALIELFDEALAAERRATVERIRAAYLAAANGAEHPVILAILDAEAER